MCPQMCPRGVRTCHNGALGDGKAWALGTRVLGQPGAGARARVRVGHLSMRSDPYPRTLPQRALGDRARPGGWQCRRRLRCRIELHRSVTTAASPGPRSSRWRMRRVAAVETAAGRCVAGRQSRVRPVSPRCNAPYTDKSVHPQDKTITRADRKQRRVPQRHCGWTSLSTHHLSVEPKTAAPTGTYRFTPPWHRACKSIGHGPRGHGRRVSTVALPAEPPGRV
jgi:hypothetical protein